MAIYNNDRDPNDEMWEQEEDNKQSPKERAFIFVALISIALTIFVTVMHEIYLYLNK